MISVKYFKTIIPINSLWFVDKLSYKKGFLDIIHDSKLEIKGAINIEKHTMFSNLNKSDDDFFANMKKNYRYEIRRGINQDGFIFNFYIGIDINRVINDFKKEYSRFCSKKGIKNTYNNNLVNKMIKINKLLLTQTKWNGIILSHHMYIIDGENARLLYSVSNFREFEDRQLVGRSNKWLHFQDMKMLRSISVYTLDWGGISNPQFMNGIDKFKFGFGGTISKVNLVFDSKYKIVKKIVRSLK